MSVKGKTGEEGLGKSTLCYELRICDTLGRPR